MSALLQRDGIAGKTVIPLDLSVRSGPVLVEAEQPGDNYLSVTAKMRHELIGDPLLHTYDRGFAGRAWTILRAGRPTRLTVKAKGPWAVRVRHIDTAERIEATATGKGPDVLAYHGPAVDATVDYLKADDGFDVDSLHLHMLPAGASDPEAVEWLVVTDKAVRQTVSLPGPCFLFVRTDGAWTIRLE